MTPSFFSCTCAISLIVAGIVLAENNLSVTGTVTDPVDERIAGASVTFISQERVRQTKSEADGSFVIHQITAGPYELEITAPGFAKQRISLNLQDHTMPPIVVALRPGNQSAEEFCGVPASVTYGQLGVEISQLSGTVQDHVHGKELRDAKVTLWRVGNSEPAAQSYSDAEGRFRFDNLLPGLYDLRIAKAGYRPVNIKRLLKLARTD
jgi:hypothetical protein